MAITTTDTRHVALFDNTEDRAFGPVFESDEHAEDYLRFAAEFYEERNGQPWDGETEVARWSLGDHEECYREWFDRRIDGETGALKSNAP